MRRPSPYLAVIFLAVSSALCFSVTGHAAQAIDYRALGSTPPPQATQTSHTDQQSLFANQNQADYDYSKPKKVGFWIDMGFGYGTTVKFAAKQVAPALNLRINDHLFTLQSSAVGHSYLLKNGNNRFVQNNSFLWSTIQSNDYGFTAYGMGLSQVRGRNRKHGGTYHAFGIPFQAQAMWTPCDFLGIGVKTFAAINSHTNSSNAGAMFVIAIGKLR